MKKTTKNDKNTERFLERDLERFDANIAALAREGKRWAADGDDEMDRQCKIDECNLRTIYDAIRARKFDRAARLIDRLDTIVRDRIPARLYNAICK